MESIDNYDDYKQAYIEIDKLREIYGNNNVLVNEYWAGTKCMCVNAKILKVERGR